VIEEDEDSLKPVKKNRTGDAEARKEIFKRGPLFNAVHMRDAAALKKALASKVDPNVVNEDGFAALHLLCFHSHVDHACVKVLLSFNADFDCRVRAPQGKSGTKLQGATPLQICIIDADVKTATYLLTLKASPNTPMLHGDHSGASPLHLVSLSKHSVVTLVRLLLGAQAPMILVDSSDRTALHYAARQEANTFAKVLLHEKCDVNLPDRQGEEPLYTAAAVGSLLLVQTLLRGKANVKWDRLDTIAKSGLQPRLLAYIARRQAMESKKQEGKAEDIVPRQLSSLWEALGDVRVAESRVNEFLDGERDKPPAQRIDLELPDHNGRHWMLQMVTDHHKKETRDIVKHWLERFIVMVTERYVSKHTESNTHQLHTVVALPAMDEDDKTGTPAIGLCLRAGNVELARHLLAHMASLDVISDSGRTPLMYAAEARHGADAVKFLLTDEGTKRWIEQGVLDHEDFDGSGAIHYACAAKNLKVLRLLLKSKANPLLKDNSGRTAMFKAVKGGEIQICEALKEAGCGADCVDSAGITLVTYVGKTPIDGPESVKHAMVKWVCENCGDDLSKDAYNPAQLDRIDDLCDFQTSCIGIVNLGERLEALMQKWRISARFLGWMLAYLNAPEDDTVQAGHKHHHRKRHNCDWVCQFCKGMNHRDLPFCFECLEFVPGHAPMTAAQEDLYLSLKVKVQAEAVEVEVADVNQSEVTILCEDGALLRFIVNLRRRDRQMAKFVNGHQKQTISSITLDCETAQVSHPAAKPGEADVVFVPEERQRSEKLKQLKKVCNAAQVPFEVVRPAKGKKWAAEITHVVADLLGVPPPPPQEPPSDDEVVYENHSPLQKPGVERHHHHGHHRKKKEQSFL